MADSTRKRLAKKPAKPHPDFPLFAHNNGQWAKKIKGKHHFFGVWADPDAALQKWVDQKDALLAGRKPRMSGGLTVAELANRFLTAKKILADGGEITPKTWADHHAGCARLVAALGGSRLVVDLAADDFEHLRAVMGSTMGPAWLKVEIQRTRSIFKYAHVTGLIEHPVRFGQLFKPPAARVIQKQRRANGPKMFEAAEILQILDATPLQLRAMILLGINCGFGNNDCASSPKSALDLDRGWVDFPRPKTGVERRCPLWPETVAALKVAIEKRPDPANPADDGLVFLTQHGNRWVRLAANARTWLDSLTLMFSKVLTRLDLKRKGRGFYALRHTFETIGGESLDQVGVNAIMGHADGTMAGVYRERVTDARLRAVADHVHGWLFGDNKTR